ncbi:MAG: type I-E CRISPR-associated endonuclease Cas1e [Acidimicrobiales bacterium]
MSYSDGAMRLLRPSVADLPRLTDRISFLFLDRVRIEQGRTGLEAWSETPEKEFLRTAIPSATLALLALGPGTSISAPAMTTLFRSGTVVIFTGADGMIGYSSARSLAATGQWAAAQARVWVDLKQRKEIARRLYLFRFPDQNIPEEVSLAVLRGLEGQMVKQTYRAMAKQHHVQGFRRVTVGAQDPINVGLNRANALLYGVALSVCSALCLNPALGFIHDGAAGALLYDLADVFKVRVSIPVAFEAAEDDDPMKVLGRLLRKSIHRHRVLDEMFTMTQDLLAGGCISHDGEDRLLGDSGFVPGLKNWHLE